MTGETSYYLCKLVKCDHRRVVIIAMEAEEPQTKEGMYALLRLEVEYQGYEIIKSDKLTVDQARVMSGDLEVPVVPWWRIQGQGMMAQLNMQQWRQDYQLIAGTEYQKAFDEAIRGFMKKP